MHTAELDTFTRPGKLFTVADEAGGLQCLACAHGCRLRSDGQRGVCKMRFSKDGVLQVPWGYVGGLHPDPIEKKPFNHFLPGTRALTFGMLGCNFHCSFCQNWEISQTLRDPECDSMDYDVREMTPEQVVGLAEQSGCSSVISSYNEPMISSEWAADIFDLAHSRGLKTAFVSNGFASRQALQFLRPRLDAFKVDLKCMNDRHYRSLGGRLQPVLDAIGLAYALGLWVEVVTLLIPGFNDRAEELWEAARFLVSVSPDIPWHVTAYHPDYHYDQAPPASAEHLQQAADIGQEAGLRYVYAGNLPGRVGSLENTYCPQCNTLLIERYGFRVLNNALAQESVCPKCRMPVSGVWS